MIETDIKMREYASILSIFVGFFFCVLYVVMSSMSSMSFISYSIMVMSRLLKPFVRAVSHVTRNGSVSIVSMFVSVRAAAAHLSIVGGRVTRFLAHFTTRKGCCNSWPAPAFPSAFTSGSTSTAAAFATVLLLLHCYCCKRCKGAKGQSREPINFSLRLLSLSRENCISGN